MIKQILPILIGTSLITGFITDAAADERYEGRHRYHHRYHERQYYDYDTGNPGVYRNQWDLPEHYQDREHN